MKARSYAIIQAIGWGAIVIAAVGLVAVFCVPARGQTVDQLGLSADESYVAPDGRTADQLIAAHVLPDPAITPGVLNPNVTPATIKSTICVHGWTATVRPPVSYTNALKVKDLPPGHTSAEYELDHLVSIEDGGSPTAPTNLWMMIYADRYGARVKDVLETKVSRAVCAGKMTLDQARAALSPNWMLGYVQYVGPLPK